MINYINSNLPTGILSEKSKRLVKLISYTSFIQSVIQIIGLASSVFIIRVLSGKEYALYTIANLVLGTITLLADGGISTGVTALGGSSWQNKEELGKIYVTALELRKKFALIAIAIAVPILIYLLLQNGASSVSIILLIVSLVPAFYAGISDSILEIIPKLHQEIVPLQKNNLHVNIGRLILTLVLLLILPWAFVAIIAAGVPRIYGNFRLRKISSNYVTPISYPDPKIRTKLLKTVSKILPGTLYYCFSSQITIWLVTYFGKTNQIAQIGALSRITVVLSVLGLVFNTIFVPRFARLQNDSKILLNRFLQILIAMILILLIAILLTYFFSGQILYLLGDRYLFLNKELVLTMIASSISMAAGLALSLHTSRGWILNPVVSILINVAGIVAGIFIFNISTLIGLLNFSIFNAVIQSLRCIIYGTYMIKIQ